MILFIPLFFINVNIIFLSEKVQHFHKNMNQTIICVRNVLLKRGKTLDQSDILFNRRNNYYSKNSSLDELLVVLNKVSLQKS